MHYKRRAHKSRRMAVFFDIPHMFGKCNTLNASLSKTVSNATYDQTKVQNLKSLLFKDCHDSWTEFINLRTNGCLSGVGEKRRRGQRDCCSCWYKQCNHYGDIKGLSKESLAYYRAIWPMCVMTVSPLCSQFWDCCIVRLRLGKKFSSLLEAEAFACGCHQVKYEKSFIDFCVEGNIYENSRRHSLHYFLNIDCPEPLTSQRLSQLTVSRENYVNDATTIGTCCIPQPRVQTVNEWCKVCKL